MPHFGNLRRMRNEQRSHRETYSMVWIVSGGRSGDPDFHDVLDAPACVHVFHFSGVPAGGCGNGPLPFLPRHAPLDLKAIGHFVWADAPLKFYSLPSDTDRELSRIESRAKGASMRKPSIRVLLIAAKSLVSSSLQQRLERRQCRCWSVPSAQ